MSAPHAGSPVDPVRVRTPNVGRMYDYYLGGKDNYAVDRAAAEAVIRAVPNVMTLARENRAFLGRVVRFMIDAGIEQFVDVGTGLPTQGHVHLVTGEHCPDARVVYVDNDQVILTHARALIPRGGRTVVIEGDMREPDRILDDERVAKLIDFERPVGVLLVAMLHFATSGDDPASIVKAFQSRLVPGSAVGLSHVTSDGPPPAALRQATTVYQKASAPLVPRTKAEVKRLFTGLAVVEPGVVYAPRWRPGPDDRRSDDSSRWLLGGVGMVTGPGWPRFAGRTLHRRRSP